MRYGGKVSTDRLLAPPRVGFREAGPPKLGDPVIFCDDRRSGRPSMRLSLAGGLVYFVTSLSRTGTDGPVQGHTETDPVRWKTARDRAFSLGYARGRIGDGESPPRHRRDTRIALREQKPRRRVCSAEKPLLVPTTRGVVDPALCVSRHWSITIRRRWVASRTRRGTRSRSSLDSLPRTYTVHCSVESSRRTESGDQPWT